MARGGGGGGGNLPFDYHLFPTDLGTREEERKERRKRERILRVRSSHFSLNFPVIGPLNFGEERGKVDPHCKSYVWVTEVWSFEKL